MPRIKKTLDFLSWNAQGLPMRSAGSFLDNLDENRPAWDFACIQEGVTHANDSWHHFLAGRKQHLLIAAPCATHLDGGKRKGATMVAINCRWKFNLYGEPSFLGPHLRVGLRIGSATCCIMSSHMPTKSKKIADYRHALEQLELLWPTGRFDHMVWGADANAPLAQEEGFCGGGGAPVSDTRGQLLRQFCLSKAVYPASCQHDETMVSTFTGNDGKHALLRDYVFLMQKDSRACVSGGSVPVALGISDHLPTVATLDTGVALSLRRIPRRKLQRWEPVDEATFKENVSSAFENLEQGSIGNLASALGHCARKQHRRKRSGLSRPTTPMVREAQARLRGAEGIAQTALARRHLRSTQQREASRLDRLRNAYACIGTWKGTWSQRTQAGRARPAPIWRIKDKTGAQHMGSEEAALEVGKYFVDLALNRAPLPLLELDFAPRDEDCRWVEPARVQAAIEILRPDKATTDEHINISVVKALPPEAVESLALAYSQVLNDRAPKAEMALLLVIECLLLRKKDAPEDSKDWRPISLVPVFLKVWEIVLDGYLAEYEPDEADPFVFGFQAGRQCADWSWTLATIIQKACQYRQPIFIAKLDVAKAFDSVEFGRMADSMRSRGVPLLVRAAYLRILAGTKVLFRLDSGQDCCEGVRKRGMWQGGRASPRLYRWVHADTMAPLLEKWRGLGWGFRLNRIPEKSGNKWRPFFIPPPVPGEDVEAPPFCIQHGTFADDEILVASSIGQLQGMVQDCSAQFAKDHSPLAAEKTSWFSNSGTCHQETMAIDGLLVPGLAEGLHLKVLGIYLSRDGDLGQDFDLTMQACWKAFWALRSNILQPLPKEEEEIQKHRGKALFRRLQCLDKVVRGILQFHALHWSLTAAQKWQVWRMQLRMARYCLQLYPAAEEPFLEFLHRANVEAKEALGKAKCSNWTMVVVQAPLHWYGHVVRTAAREPTMVAAQALRWRGYEWRARVRACNFGRLQRGHYGQKRSWETAIENLMSWLEWSPEQLQFAAGHDNWKKLLARIWPQTQACFQF
jgi:hypothetical protein